MIRALLQHRMKTASPFARRRTGRRCQARLKAPELKRLLQGSIPTEFAGRAVLRVRIALWEC